MVDSLVVLNSSTAVTRSGDDNASTTSNQALDNFYTNRALTDTSKKCVLVLESSTRGGNLCKDVKVYMYVRKLNEAKSYSQISVNLVLYCQLVPTLRLR